MPSMPADPTVPARRASVLLVEDDAHTRGYLAQAVAAHPELQLQAACADLAEARAALDQARPDLLLTDLALPDGNGVDLIAQVQREHPGTECMVISVFGSEQRVLAAVAAGASGYLLKDEAMDRIGEAIVSLLAGGSPMSPAIARHILNRCRAPVGTDGEDMAVLTEREAEVLTALSRGFTYQEIAAQLGLSAHTVGTHIKHIYRKLEVGSRAEAVFEAVQLGLIRLQ
ncbi:response regulator transcription factor [Piscinibacter sp.]|uniref:response regulator transcription factor n=1 Tax=Piscinibacter sp. TaxID=1903157 RepID=UPI002C814F21|nr:response regulator transcription factor [Albitalea sp.]HUG24767.1 response regulator transcription factor [Albitalea sp.]